MFNTKNRIIAAVVLCTLLAALTIGGFSLFYIKDRIRTHALEYLSENTQIYGEKMNTIITQVETVTATLSKSVAGIIDPERINDSYYYYRLTDELENIANEFDENDFNIMSIYVRFNPLISFSTSGIFHSDTDGDGILEKQKPTNLLRYDPSDVEHVGWFYEPFRNEKATWLDPYYNANVGINMLSYILPLEVNGEIIGVVGADINFERFEHIVKDGPSMGSALLLNEQHQFLVHDGISSIDDIMTASQSFQGKDNGTFNYMANNKNRIAGFSRLQNGWLIIDSLTESEAFIDLNRTINFLMLFNTILVIIMTLIATLVGRQLNEMILKNSQLEKMVSDRTKQLSIANEELETSLQQLEIAQAQLISSEKLAFLGELVAGVAHEINTPLGMGITLNSYMHQKVTRFKEQVDSAAISKQNLFDCMDTMQKTSASALQNLQRVAEIVDMFKQLSVDHSGMEESQILVNDYLAKIMMNLSTRLKDSQHQIHIDCDQNLKISTYPNIFTQIVVNLFTISLEHSLKDIKAGTINLAFHLTNDSLQMSYSDNGIGIPDEDFEKIINPFFSKTQGFGSVGLSLHIIHSLVTHTLKGTIKRNNTRTHGIGIIIELPLHMDSHNI